MPPYFSPSLFKTPSSTIHIVLGSAPLGAGGAGDGPGSSCVFSLELSFEGLAHFLTLGRPLEVAGMLDRASILHHHAICLLLPLGINDSV